MNCLSNCCLSQQNDSVECVWKICRSYPSECYGVKCTCRCVCVGVCVYVCVRTYTCLHVWVSVLCATIRLNPQLSLTGLAEWTAEVYHCLLIFLWFPSAHQGRTFCEWPQWESLLAGPGLTYLRGFKASRHPSFCVRKSQISQSYQGQQMLPSLLPVCEKIQFDCFSSEALRDQSNQWITADSRVEQQQASPLWHCGGRGISVSSVVNFFVKLNKWNHWHFVLPLPL